MDLPQSIFPYLTPNSTTSLNTDDSLNFFFPSPNTDIDDTTLNPKLTPHPHTSALPSTHTHAHPQLQHQPHHQLLQQHDNIHLQQHLHPAKPHPPQSNPDPNYILQKQRHLHEQHQQAQHLVQSQSQSHAQRPPQPQRHQHHHQLKHKHRQQPHHQHDQLEQTQHQQQQQQPQRLPNPSQNPQPPILHRSQQQLPSLPPYSSPDQLQPHHSHSRIDQSRSHPSASLSVDSFLESSPTADSLYDPSKTNDSVNSLSFIPGHSPGTPSSIPSSTGHHPGSNKKTESIVHQVPPQSPLTLAASSSGSVAQTSSQMMMTSTSPSPPSSSHPELATNLQPHPSIPTVPTQQQLSMQPSFVTVPPSQQIVAHPKPEAAQQRIHEQKHPAHLQAEMLHQQSQSYVTTQHHQATTVTPSQSQSACLTQSSGTGSKQQIRASVGVKSAKRDVKRDRSLQVMKAVASNNAPDVILTDEELLKIGAMHESDISLAQSKEIYETLVLFKKSLSKHGYQLTGLHLQTVPLNQAAKAFSAPIDFVLKKINTDSPPSDTQEPHDVTNLQQPHQTNQADCQQHNIPQHAVDQSPVSAVGKGIGHGDESKAAVLAAAIDMVDTGSGGGGTGINVGKRPRSMCNSTSDSSESADVGMSGEMDRQLLMMREGIDAFSGTEATRQLDDDVDGTRSSEGSGSKSRKRARLSKGESSTSREAAGGDGIDSRNSTQRIGCVVCSKTMSDLPTLVRHFRHAHQELKPFSCPRCNGLYSSEGTLWHHIRNVHKETPRKYKCDYCDASYDSCGAKTRHEHATHNTGTPKFHCTFKDCDRSFNFPAHLEAHALQAHPGFKPFGCRECPKRFPSANGLTRHVREVHLRPQAYSCSCSKSYSKRCHLKRHLLRVHGMSMKRVQEEMAKQPHPGLLHMVPKAPPASTD